MNAHVHIIKGALGLLLHRGHAPPTAPLPSHSNSRNKTAMSCRNLAVRGFSLHEYPCYLILQCMAWRAFSMYKSSGDLALIKRHVGNGALFRTLLAICGHHRSLSPMHCRWRWSCAASCRPFRFLDASQFQSVDPCARPRTRLRFTDAVRSGAAAGAVEQVHLIIFSDL